MKFFKSAAEKLAEERMANSLGNDCETVISVERISMKFGSKVVYQDVSFQVKKREIFILLGGSGSGKSTLMRQLVGLYPHVGGRINVLGRPMPKDIKLVRPRIGVMFQSGALFGAKTVLENVMLPLEIFTDLPKQARQEIAAMKLDLVGLSDALDLLPSEISGGMVKRAAIARALALNPPLVFMDEPGAGLDPVTSAGLDRLILDLRDQFGITFIIVSHELASIFAIGDRCIMLDSKAKSLIADDDPRKLRDHSTDKRVTSFFLRETL